MTTTERIWFPCVEYRIVATGELVKFPPANDIPYQFVIHDLEEFRRIVASGEIRDPRHTGREYKIIDNRKTTQ